MTAHKDRGNMRFNHDEENLYGQSEHPPVSRSPAAPAAQQPASETAAANTAAVSRRACRQHIDEAVGGAHGH